MSMIDSIVSFKSAESMARVQMAVAAKVLKISQGQGQVAADMVQAAMENVEESMTALLDDIGSNLDAYG